MSQFENKCVILLTIDALRRDHLKSYGYHRNTAPNLEKMVEKGCTFLSTFTNGPESPSSFSTIFSSVLPFLNGGYSPLPPQKIIFPEILKENGIFTYAIHNNPNLGKIYNYNRGFDIFLDGKKMHIKEKFQNKIQKAFKIKPSIRSFIKKKIIKILEKLFNFSGVFNNIKKWLSYKFPALVDLFMPYIPLVYEAPYITKRIITFLKNFNKPFFLFAHLMDIHSPYNPPKRNLLKFRKYNIKNTERNFLHKEIFWKPQKYKITSEIVNKLKDLYDGSINFLDEYLSKIFDAINANFNKNCLIIITADHGDSLFEHGYFGHLGHIFDQLLKIPLFIIEIGKNLYIRKIKETVQLIDIAPTILDYFEIDILDCFQGESLLPLLEGKSIRRREYVISEAYQKAGKIKRNNNTGYKLIAIRKKDWKYVFDEEKSTEYLFDLKNDANEKINLAGINKSILIEFRNILENHLQDISDTAEKSKIMHSINKIHAFKN